VYERQKISYT